MLADSSPALRKAAAPLKESHKSSSMQILCDIRTFVGEKKRG